MYVNNEPFMASISLGKLESTAIALFVMKKMRKQKTCVNSDRKNTMIIDFKFWCRSAGDRWIATLSGYLVAFTYSQSQ